MAISMCVVGVSGSGKTSLMSMLGAELRTSCHIPVIIRYCGTSSMSCEGFSLVRSLIWQIRCIYGLEQDRYAWPAFERFDLAVQALHALLEQYPVVLLIDSLDQLSNQYEEKSSISFLKGCRAHKNSIIIVSTLPDDRDLETGKVKLFQAESLLEQNHISCITVPVLETQHEVAVKKVVDLMLARNGRALHYDAQWQTMWKSIQTEPTMLYLTLACIEAGRWKSTDTVALTPTVKGIIQAMFARLEKVYGVELMKHAIGFLTFSKSGLSNMEMLDLLSMSDAVLDEVFQYAQLETVRRVPVHVWLRVRQELSPFLAEKTSGALRWYHRQLWETAGEKYTKQDVQQFHVLMGQYFANILPEGIRRRLIISQDIILSSPSQQADAFRQCNSSAVWYQDSVVNTRRCAEACFHLVQAEMFDEAVLEICDVRHVCAYLRAGQGYSLLLMLSVLNRKRDISHYYQWLQGSMSALVMDPIIQVVITALGQPISSAVRQTIGQQAIPNGALHWLNRRIGGWSSFGRLLMDLHGHTREITSLCAAPQFDRIISGSIDKTVKIWDLSCGKCVGTLDEHTDEVTSVAISSDGSRFISASNDCTIKLYDTQSLCCLKTFRGHDSAVLAVCISSDGHLVVSGSNDRTVKLWDHSGLCMRTLRDHSDAVTAVCMTRDNSKIISGSSDTPVKIWNAKSGHLLQTLYHGYKSEVVDVCVSQDGSKLVSADKMNTVKVWSTALPEYEYECLLSINVTEGVLKTMCLSEDSTIITTGSDETVVVWDALSGKRLHSLKGQSTSVPVTALFMVNGAVISGDSSGTIKVWRKGFLNDHETELIGHSTSINALCFNFDGSKLISSAENIRNKRAILIWDVQSGTCCSKWENRDSNCIGYNNGNVFLQVLHQPSALEVYAMDSLQCAILNTNSKNDVIKMAFTPDGQCIMMLQLSAVQVWDLQSMKCLRTFEWIDYPRDGSDPDRFSSVISTDSKTVSVFTDRGKHKMWDISSGQQLQDVAIHGFTYPRCDHSCWFPDGRHIASVRKAILSVWDVQSGVELLKITEHKLNITCVQVTPDGSKMVSGSWDKTMRLWDMITGFCLGCFYYSSPVWKLAISADGSKIVSGCSDGQVRLIELSAP